VISNAVGSPTLSVGSGDTYSPDAIVLSSRKRISSLFLSEITKRTRPWHFIRDLTSVLWRLNGAVLRAP
jgi:hypothetical protein